MIAYKLRKGGGNKMRRKKIYTGSEILEAKLKLGLCFGKLGKFDNIFDEGFEKTETEAKRLISVLPEQDRGFYETKYGRIMSAYDSMEEKGKKRLWKDKQEEESVSGFDNPDYDAPEGLKRIWTLASA